MDAQMLAASSTSNRDVDHGPPIYLNGWRLQVARAGWATVFVVAVVVFAVSCAAIYLAHTVPCPENITAFNAEQLSRCDNFQTELYRIGLSPAFFGTYLSVLRVAATVPYFALGLLLVLRRPSQLRVLLFSAFLAVIGAAGTWFNPLWDWADFVVPALTVPVMFLGTLLLFGTFFGYTFPDGRFVPRWTRWLVVIFAPIAVFHGFLLGSPLDYETWSVPLPQVINLGALGTSIYALVYRYRYAASPVQRQQIKWVVAGASLIFLNWLVDYAAWSLYPALTGVIPFDSAERAVLWELVQDSSWYIAQFAFAICLGLAVFRYRLWDIDLIVNRALVYGALTVSVVVLYVLIVGSLGVVLQAQGSLPVSLVAVGLVALLFEPIRERVQRSVNRLMFGERDDPYAVLSGLGRRLETSLAPEMVLPTVVEVVAQALRLPYVAIELSRDGGFVTAAEYGGPASQSLHLPLVYRGEMVGRLALGHRSGESSFAPSDVRLLQGIARQVGVAARTVSLATDLQRSLERLVAVQEEERRRLRRDLHDGLGPTLASLSQRLDVASVLVSRDPDAAVSLLGSLRQQVRTTIADVRRLVYALRPPALDEFGLAEALRQHLGEWSETHGVRGTLSADPLPALPAAVEVAAYRIVVEALANVARHAQATQCQVHLRLDHGLVLEVADDGIGLPSEYRAGVGITSMRERTMEVGGEYRIEMRPGGGTLVSARLPLPDKE